MGSRLDWITDLEDIARQARYRVNVVARRLNVSRQDFHAHIHQTLGCSPRVWIRRLRLRRAEALLVEKRPIKEIAHQLGMRPTSICRWFHRVVGCAPESYRLAAVSIHAQGHTTWQPKPPPIGDGLQNGQTTATWSQRGFPPLSPVHLQKEK